MAYDNRPNLNCKQFDQRGSDYLYLAGYNCICSGGTISSNNGYQVSGVTIFDTGKVSSSIQIGCNAISSGIAATVVGTGALASGLTSISIGCNAKACGNGSISIGTLSKSNNLCSVSIGCGSISSNNYSISIGADALSYGDGGIAIGRAPKAYQNSVSIGDGSCATNIAGIAIGSGSIALNSSTIAIGNTVLGYCTYSHVIGSYICNNTKNSIGFGWHSGVTYQTPAVLFSNNVSYFYGSGNSKVAFGHCNPTARVDIYTTSTCGFKLVDGNQGAGKVLTSDANGYATWCTGGGGGGITSANNGLTKSGCNVRLGGTLTGDTSILGGYMLSLDGIFCSNQNIYANNFILTSDARCKANVSSISIAPVNVEYKQFEMINEPNQIRYGVLAQELQTINPELVRVDCCGYMSVSYIDLLIKEIAYLKHKVCELEKKLI